MTTPKMPLSTIPATMSGGYLTTEYRNYLQQLSDTIFPLNQEITSTLTPRGHTISLTGDVTGFASISSGETTTINTTVAINSVSFSEISDKPTTIAGYGITDAYNKSEIDTKFANINFSSIINKPSSLSGYGITDAYTSAQIDSFLADKASLADLSLKADISSPTFTGSPAAPTQPSTDNSTKLATTAFVATAVYNRRVPVLDPDSVTISGGVATVPAGKAYLIIEPESDLAADELDTLSGGEVHQILVIQRGAQNITVTGNGNITAAGITMDSDDDSVTLYKSGANSWLVIGARLI